MLAHSLGLATTRESRMRVSRREDLPQCRVFLPQQRAQSIVQEEASHEYILWSGFDENSTLLCLELNEAQDRYS